MAVDLSNQVAIVTGAGKGLGRAYAMQLAACGAAVLVNNWRHPGETDADTSAMSTVDAIRQAGGRAEPNWDDVSGRDSGRNMVEQALKVFGRLDAVVANAGVDRPQTFRKLALNDIEQLFDINFFGNLHLVHAAWSVFHEQARGRIVLTSSGAGLYGNHGQAAYSAAKAAVIGLAGALAIEGRNRGIRVNVVAPYAVSQLTEGYLAGPLAERFSAERVAPLVTWLASEQCQTSGEVLVCGAGLVRRAATGETAALPMDADPQRTLEALRALPLRFFDNASESFAQLCEESEAQA